MDGCVHDSVGNWGDNLALLDPNARAVPNPIGSGIGRIFHRPLLSPQGRNPIRRIVWLRKKLARCVTERVGLRGIAPGAAAPDKPRRSVANVHASYAMAPAKRYTNVQPVAELAKSRNETPPDYKRIQSPDVETLPTNVDNHLRRF